MHRFKNILCVVNPDETETAVVRRASDLATLHGTKLTLVHVVEELPGADLTSDSGRGASLAISDAGERRMLDENGVVGDLVSQPLRGSPSEAIVK